MKLFKCHSRESGNQASLIPAFAGMTLIFLGLSVSSVSSADIGRTETKRDRIERERRESSGPSVSDAYLKIHENFLRENYLEVDRLADSYLSGGRGKPNSEDVLYLQALSLLKLHRGDEARTKLKELEINFESSDRKASASASIADSYFYEGNQGQAYQAYQETLRKYPNSDQTAYVLYRLRDLSVKLGKPQDSDYFKASVLKANPDSQQVKDSISRFSSVTQVPQTAAGPLKQMSLEEAPFFTVQVGSFSKVRNANALMNKLIIRSYSAFIDKDTPTGMYRVRVGHLPSKAEADVLEARLKSEGYPTKIYP